MNLTDLLSKTLEQRKLLQQEQTIFQVTELICELMQRQNITDSQMSKKLGISLNEFRYVLGGDTSTPISMISDILFILGWRLGDSILIQPLQKNNCRARTVLAFIKPKTNEKGNL